jgi:hypothetical protein
MKAFQGSGVLYVLDNKIIFQDTLNQNPYSFDLKQQQLTGLGSMQLTEHLTGLKFRTNRQNTTLM